MSKNINILKSAEEYINKYDQGKSVEELFIEFQKTVKAHEAFEKYLKENNINQKLERMKRGERSLARRKLFSNWYLDKTQNEIDTKEAKIVISDMTFSSVRTTIKDLSSEATA